MKSMVVTVAGHALHRGKLPTQPQLPPYIQPRRLSANKPQVCRGGAQPRKKRIATPNQYNRGDNKTYQYPQNRDNQALTVTISMITTLNVQNHISGNCIGSVIIFFILTQLQFVYMERYDSDRHTRLNKRSNG